MTCRILGVASARTPIVVAGQDPLYPTTLSRLAVLAFFHDFAKFNSSFQFKARDPNDHEKRCRNVVWR